MNLDLEEFRVINIDSKVRTLKYTKYDIRIYNSLSYRLIIDIQNGFSKFREAFYLVRLAGFEPAHPVPETGALSPEL